MNKTRKLTQGAMLLAIVGALMALDRQFGYLFSYLIVMMFAVIIIIYSAMYTVKDGVFLGLCLGVLTLLLGDPQSTYLYYPICTISGIVYSFFLKKNAPKKLLLVSSIAVFVLGEILVFYLIQPLFFDLTIAKQVESVMEIYNEMGYEEMLGSLETLGFSAGSFILAALAMGVVFYGVIEGAMIHLFSIFLLKRFRIMDIRITPLTAKRPNPIVAYVCFGMVALLPFYQYYQQNDTLFMIAISAITTASLVLAFYGYIYFVAMAKIRMGRTGSLIIVLAFFVLFPISYFALVIFGFLYASGPLYDRLQRMIEEINERNKRDITKL